MLKLFLFKFFILILFLVSNSYSQDSQDLCSFPQLLVSNPPKPIISLQFLGRGYNVFFGNPRSMDGDDQGYRGGSIFQYAYNKTNNQHLTVDRNWKLPNAIRFTSVQCCSVEFSSRKFDSMKSYNKVMEGSLKIEGEWPQGALSASTTTKYIVNTLQNTDSVIIESSAECIVADLSVHDTQTSHPILTDDFVERITSLEQQGENQEEYHNFFDEFGTHVVTSLKLGSRYGRRSTLSSANYKIMQDKNLNIESGASGYGISISASRKHETNSAKEFASKAENVETFSLGALPDKDVSSWASQSVTNPQPLSLTITTYSKAIEKFTIIDKKGLTNEQINNLKQRFSKYLLTYCENRKDKIPYCQNFDPRQDVVIPDKPQEPKQRLFTISDQQMNGTYLSKISGSESIEQASVDSGFSSKFLMEEKQGFVVFKLGTNPQLCITSGTQENSTLFMFQCNDTASQQYKLEEISKESKEFNIKSLLTGMYITGNNMKKNSKNNQDENQPCERAYRFCISSKQNTKSQIFRIAEESDDEPNINIF